MTSSFPKLFSHIAWFKKAWSGQDKAMLILTKKVRGSGLLKHEGGKQCDIRFSNRPFEVERSQTVHRCSVDVARGLALLFGLGALPSWDSKTRWNNLNGGLAVRQTAGSSGHANSPH